MIGGFTELDIKIKKQLLQDFDNFASNDKVLPKIANQMCIRDSNNLDGGYKIAQKVLSLGKKNILILSGNRADLYPLNDRLKGMLSVFNLSLIHIF